MKKQQLPKAIQDILNRRPAPRPEMRETAIAFVVTGGGPVRGYITTVPTIEWESPIFARDRERFIDENMKLATERMTREKADPASEEEIEELVAAWKRNPANSFIDNYFILNDLL